MNEDFDYNSIDLTATANELYGDAGSSTQVEDKNVDQGTASDTADKAETADKAGDAGDAGGDDENDNPFAEEEGNGEDKTETSEDPDDEVLKKLELEEKWRVKRLNKEIEAKKQAEAEAARLKAEIEELKAGRGTKQEESNATGEIQFDDAKFKIALIERDPEIKALHEKVEYIKSVKESFDDMGAYADALLEAQADLKSEIKDRKRDFLNYQKQEQVQQTQGANKILEEFDAKVEAVKENYPMVDKAKELLQSKAGELHVEIRRALLLDENAGELTWTIGASKKNLQYLVEASAIASRTGQLPLDAIKMMGKWSSEISAAKGSNGTANAPAKKAPVKPAGVPKDIRSKPVASHDDMDPYEYAEKLLAGKIKNTLY